jgi:hypothetical protein
MLGASPLMIISAFSLNSSTCARFAFEYAIVPQRISLRAGIPVCIANNALLVC